AEQDSLLNRINEELYKRNAELAVRNKTLALLRKLDEISLAAVKMEEVANRIAAAIAGELGYEIVSVAIVQEKKKTLQWLAVASEVPWVAKAVKSIDLTEASAPLGDGLVSIQAVATGKESPAEGLAQVFPPVIADSIMQTVESKVSDPAMHSMLYPLKFGGQNLGLLTFSTTRSWDTASKYELESITGIIGLVSLALYKTKIYEDLQQTSAELALANEKLTELDKVKSEFLSIASHQLYTPLTALRGYISMLSEGDFGQLSDKQQEILDILNKSAVHLIELIKGLLDISRIEAGRLELKLESIDLAEVTRQLVQDLMPNAMEKKLELEFHDPGKPTHIVADQERLRQVMLNFIDNAIKYTDKGRVDVYVKQDKGSAVFTVQDTGKGISHDDILRLFTKFTRVGGAAKYHTQGTGLGLYVAKQIVKEHHGEVSVGSPGMGRGSTFSVELPIEGAPDSLRVGETATVEIKAAEAGKEQQESLHEQSSTH
ncbi:MAG: HAMP domain-containing sensor histidine kinase, partial [Candidatus Andersenbacteria bacterium]